MFFSRKNTRSSDILDINSPEGLEQAYDLYAEQMFIICYNRVGDQEVGKEIVQDIFKSLIERRGKLTITGSIKHYLLRSTKLELIDYFRKKTRQEKHLQSALEDYTESEHYTENELNLNELQEQVNILIDSLPSQCRSVYKLSREKGLTNKEIASSLDISTKTVESHMTKALHFLKANLTEYQY